MGTSLYDYCIQNRLEALLCEWDTESNAPLTPKDISYGSNRSFHWKCSAGHQWTARIFNRSRLGRGCPYCSGRLATPDESLAHENPSLCKQWHPEKNLPLRPDQVRPMSHRSVWWICEKGHEWTATIASRSSGTGCPVCTKKVILPGVNDLGTTHPHLAAQWHIEKNTPLTVQQVAYGSERKVWWRCSNGHEWLATISSRAKGIGCPYCSNKLVIAGENDLASRYPDIAAQWLQSRNGALRPEQVAFGSNRFAWWVCEKGHQWRASIALRTQRMTACPYCAGQKVLAGFNDLLSQRPEIAKDWHPTLNRTLSADQVTVGSTRRVWWRCPDGHVWRTAVYNRTGKQATNCPICVGNISAAKRRYYESIERETALAEIMRK